MGGHRTKTKRGGGGVRRAYVSPGKLLYGQKWTKIFFKWLIYYTSWENNENERPNTGQKSSAFIQTEICTVTHKLTTSKQLIEQLTPNMRLQKRWIQRGSYCLTLSSNLQNKLQQEVWEEWCLSIISSWGFGTISLWIVMHWIAVIKIYVPTIQWSSKI